MLRLQSPMLPLLGYLLFCQLINFLDMQTMCFFQTTRFYIGDDVDRMLRWGAGYSPKLSAICVVFRGTVKNSTKNILRDLNLIKLSYKCDGCKVHHGFYNGMISMKDPMLTAIAKLLVLSPKARMFVTGFSLGAALTVLSPI